MGRAGFGAQAPITVGFFSGTQGLGSWGKGGVVGVACPKMPGAFMAAQPKQRGQLSD